jgi:hypothetical protein
MQGHAGGAAFGRRRTELLVDIDLAKLIFYHRYVLGSPLLEDVIKQRRFPRAQEASDDRDRYLPF